MHRHCGRGLSRESAIVSGYCTARGCRTAAQAARPSLRLPSRARASRRLCACRYSGTSTPAIPHPRQGAAGGVNATSSRVPTSAMPLQGPRAASRHPDFTGHDREAMSDRDSSSEEPIPLPRYNRAMSRLPVKRAACRDSSMTSRRRSALGAAEERARRSVAGRVNPRRRGPPRSPAQSRATPAAGLGDGRSDSDGRPRRCQHARKGRAAETDALVRALWPTTSARSTQQRCGDRRLDEAVAQLELSEARQ